MTTISNIEKNVPMPPPKLGRPTIYAFANMEVGDSFNVFVGGDYAPDVRGRVAASASQFIKCHAPERKFKTRISEQGVRIWRVR